MTKSVYTPYGNPLSDEALRLVKDVRLKINQPIHPNFDTDFNIYRFIMSAERAHKKEKDVINHAAKTLNNHLRIRKALDLDAPEIKSFDENPIFTQKLMPRGDILDACDEHNRLLWYIEYATITVESIAHSIQSSQACKYQFWHFEYMLRKVMKQEEKTGCLSSLRHVVDMNGYEINPFTMLFVTSGTLAYYSQLFHFENFPELVTPVEIVNIAKWIHVPYKLAKTMMPAGFSEKFRLHDNHFLKTLTEDIALDNIPTTLGGNNTEVKCVGAEKVDPAHYWQPSNHHVLDEFETVHVPARKSKYINISITTPKKLSWYFSTDGDVYFGIFYQEDDKNDSEIDLDNMEMVYPWLKLSAKLVHEQDFIDCIKPGKYTFVLCNKHSWLSRRTVELFLTISDTESNKRVHSDETFSNTKIVL